MLFYVKDLQWTRDGQAIERAVRARDPQALVVAGHGHGVRIVARLDQRRMLEALEEAGLAAIPETRMPAGTLAA
jgi:hypothetical protein